MNRIYIKPSIKVMAIMSRTPLLTVSVKEKIYVPVKGEINDPSDYTINAKGYNGWDDWDE